MTLAKAKSKDTSISQASFITMSYDDWNIFMVQATVHTSWYLFLPSDRIVFSFLNNLIISNLIWLIIIIIQFNKWIGRGLNYWSKIPCVSPRISEILSSTFIETLWQEHTAATFSKRQTDIGLFYLHTILRKLSCPNNKKEALKSSKLG